MIDDTVIVIDHRLSYTFSSINTCATDIAIIGMSII